MTRMTRNSRTIRARFLAGVLALTLLLAGCSSEPTRDDGRVTLRFQSLAWQQESVEATKELVDEWNALHPEIQVEYVQGSWDSVHDQLLTSFEEARRPTSSTTPPTTSPTSRTAATSPTSRTCCPSGSPPTSRRSPGSPSPSATASTVCPSSRSRASSSPTPSA